MGHCKKILASKTIPSIPSFLSNQMVVEIAENFHFHYRNYRMEFDNEEFEKISLAFIESYSRWNLMGRKKSVRYKYPGDKNVVLSKSEISPHPSLSNSDTSVNNFRVELQKYADHIHVHYKEFRFEFTLSEFEIFAQVIQDAQEDLKKVLIKNDSPKRTGYFHRSVPFGQVDEKNNQNYWLYPGDIDTKNIFESTYNSIDEKSLIIDRFTEKPYLYRIHVDDLYTSTLYYKGYQSPWGVDDRNIFLPLKNRLEFVKLYFANDLKLTEGQIKSSSYFKLLTEGIEKIPRDGGTDSVYKDPLIQCHRFIKLIQSILAEGYITVSDKDTQDEFSTILMKDSSGLVSPQNTRTDLPSNVISFHLVAGLPQVHNGLHRLAILKYLYDVNLLKDPLILVAHLNKKPISSWDYKQIKFDKNGFPLGNLRYRDYRFKEVINKTITKFIGFFSILSSFPLFVITKVLVISNSIWRKLIEFSKRFY